MTRTGVKSCLCLLVWLGCAGTQPVVTGTQPISGAAKGGAAAGGAGMGGGVKDPPPNEEPGPLADLDRGLLSGAGVDPGKIACNSDNRWGNGLRRDAQVGADDLLAALGPALTASADRDGLRKKLAGLLFWRMVRAVLLEGNTNNLGVFALRDRTYVDAAGGRRPVLVFRSGMTPDPDQPGSCFRSLLEAGGVRHVVNLFDGEIPAADMTAAEAKTASQHGASYRTASDDPAAYGPWRDILRKHYDDPAQRQRATQGVARLIREQILMPDGAAPRGNIHIHCGGGMHRSGMIAGVLERCVNREPWTVVAGHYLYHVGYRDAAHAGGREDGNLRFIREFDCALLDP